TSAQGMTRIADIARNRDLQDALLSPTPVSNARASERLRALGPAGQDQTVELRDQNNHVVARYEESSGDARLIPAVSARPPVGPGPLEVVADHLYTRTVAEVEAPTPKDHAGPIGYIVVTRILKPTPTSSVSSLVGNGATVLVGNQSGSVWTDLATVVP